MTRFMRYSNGAKGFYGCETVKDIALYDLYQTLNSGRM